MEVESKPSTSFQPFATNSTAPAASTSTSTAPFFGDNNVGFPGAVRLASILADPVMLKWIKPEVKITISNKEQNKNPSKPIKRRKFIEPLPDFGQDFFSQDALDDDSFYDEDNKAEVDFYGDEEDEDADWGAFQPKVEMAEGFDDYDDYPEADVIIKTEDGEVGEELKGKKKKRKKNEGGSEKTPRKKRRGNLEKELEDREDIAGDEFRARTCKLDCTSLDDYVVRVPVDTVTTKSAGKEEGVVDGLKKEPNSDGEEEKIKPEKTYNKPRSGKPSIYEMGMKMYACPFCIYSHKRKSLWTTHLKNWHPEKDIKFCQSLFHGQVCGFPYLKEETLKEHAKSHEREPIECDVCGKTFKMPSQMRQHRQSHMPRTKDPNKPATEHICSFCGKVFGSKTGYKHHEMMVHTKNFKFICDFDGCGKPFFDRTALDTHKNKHLGALPFVCTYCGAGFAGKGLMKAHEKRVHESDGEAAKHSSLTQNAECPICHKVLRKRNLPFHIRIHQGLEKAWCTICGKEFPTEGARKRHELIHKDIKKFACRFCGKDFVQKNNMLQHERTHTGEKPYSCTICGQGFMLARVKKEHMKDCQGAAPTSLLNLNPSHPLYK